MKVSIDTRTLESGDIFIPIKGKNFDGHQFIDDAIKKGASKVILEDIGTFASKYRKKLSCPIIAITGSYGKTTAKDMLYYVLREKFNVTRTLENQNNEIGVPLTLLNADSNTDLLILELGMRKKGDIAYLTKIVRPTHVIITGIGYSHIAFFKSPSEIANAKGEILRSALTWETPLRSCFINQDTDFYDKLAKKAINQGYRLFPYHAEEGIDQNIALCYLVGKHFGLSDHEIQTGINQYHPSSHRMEKSTHGSITLIDDTYNANPHGMKYALSRLKTFSGRKICVLGDMLELGKHSKELHQSLTEAMIDAEVSIAYVHGEEMRQITSDSLPIHHFNTKAKLNQAILEEIKPGDTILFKGSRSMKLEETVAYIKEML